MQAEAIKTAIEAHRSRKPFCMGSLYWQLNDCWPVASWSSIDYFGRWKALHYSVRKAYQEILVIPAIEDGKLLVRAVNDRLTPMEGKLVLEIIQFNGEKLWQTSRPFVVDSHSSQVCFEARIDDLLTETMDRRQLLLRTAILENDIPISENLLYFLPPKQLELPEAKVNIEVSETTGGYQIALSSDVLAKNVYLYVDSIDGFFSDNYFDLLPGQKVTLHFRCDQKWPNLRQQIRIMTLRDSY